MQLSANSFQMHQVQTNFPPGEYGEGLAEMEHTSIADFIVALQRHGAFESQRTSRWPLLL